MERERQIVTRKVEEVVLGITPAAHELQTTYLYKGGLKAVGILALLRTLGFVEEKTGLPIFTPRSTFGPRENP